MKGDDFTKKIVIKFLGAGYKNQFQLRVKIYDLNNELVCKGITYNGKISFLGCEKSFYVIKAYNEFVNINKTIYISDYDDYYIPIYNVIINNSRNIVTFLLTDANYNDLPISKGEMILWQKQ